MAKATKQDETVEKVEETKTEEITKESPKKTKKDATPVAKAGKRSEKAIKEAEEAEAKEERKRSGEASEVKPKKPVKPARSKLERRSKKYRDSASQIDKTKNYNIGEAVALSKKTSSVKFDATVEIHINLAVDPRHADQNIRDSIVLPNGLGKKVKVAALSDDPKVAKDSGADIVEAEEIFKLLDKGVTDFDVLVATPAQMPKLGKYARLLGPRGLMPNPKSGSVTNDIEKAVKEAKTGKVEYRVDSSGIVHLGVGKVSFNDDQLKENIETVINSIKQNKPQSVKGSYIKSMHLTTSMGPSVRVDLVSIA